MTTPVPKTKTYTMTTEVTLPDEDTSPADAQVLAYAEFKGYGPSESQTPLEYISSMWQKKFVDEFTSLVDNQFIQQKSAAVEAAKESLQNSVNVTIK